MYSVVMMMALTGAAETPSFGCKGCRGSCACWGAPCTNTYSTGAWGGGGFGGCCAGSGCFGGFGVNVYSCYGSSAWGGGSGYTCLGAYSCYGALTNYGPYMNPGYCYGYGMPMAPAPVAPGSKMPGVEPIKKPVDGTPPKKAAAPAPASVVVKLPAAAELLANGQMTSLTSETRRFSTPELEPGKSFFYVLTAR